jgi:hypothetical protein
MPLNFTKVHNAVAKAHKAPAEVKEVDGSFH